MTVTPIHHATARRARLKPRRGASSAELADPAVLAESAVLAEPAVLTEPSQWSFTVDVQIRGAADPAMLQLVRDLHRLVAASTPSTPSYPDARQDLVDPYRDGPVLHIDARGRTVTRGGRSIVLSRLEFDVLHYFAEHPGRVFTRAELLAAIWHDDKSGSRTVDVHVRRIRAKVGDQVIHTVRNVGYRLSQSAHVELSA